MTLPSDLKLVRDPWDGGWRLYAPTADPSRDMPLARGTSGGLNSYTNEWARPDVSDYARAIAAIHTHLVLEV
jgi:hypothetical protein